MKPGSAFHALLAGLAVCGLLAVPIDAAHAQAANSTRIAVALFGPHESLQQVIDGFKQELVAQGIKATYEATP